MRDNALNGSQSQCGTYVRYGLEAGFGLERDALKGKTVDQSGDNLGYAKTMGPYLEKLGFQAQPVNTRTFLKGDIAVIQSYEGGSPAGHAQMYDGEDWISDFLQLDGFWPGSGYERSEPSFVIYRW